MKQKMNETCQILISKKYMGIYNFIQAHDKY